MTGDTERFLRALGGRFTFQTFGEGNARDNRALSRILHGTFAEHADKLAALNARGAGVFVMVNEGDGNGRTIRNVQRIRAYFADFDGNTPPDLGTLPLRPHCVIESSPGRWHWYWFIDGAPLTTFAAVQSAIAERFGSDPTMKDLPRVLRLPGFLHQKHEPFLTRIVELRDAPRYQHADFIRAFGIDLSAPESQSRGKRPTATRDATITPLPTAHKRRTLPASIPEGERNTTLLSLGGGLVHKGHDLLAVTRRLQRINAERCTPPLCAAEVDTIAMRAVAYGSDGFRILPDRLLDSPEWRALSPPAHDVILAAYRRFDGFNNGNIALPWSDFRDRDGFRNEAAFYRHRAAAVQSRILIESRKARHTQHGITPTLYAIAERFLQVSLTADCGSSATATIRMPYIDKQACRAVAVVGAVDTRLQATAQTSQRGTTR